MADRLQTLHEPHRDVPPPGVKNLKMLMRHGCSRILILFTGFILHSFFCSFSGLSGPLVTRMNRPLFLPAIDLTTNRVVGLTNTYPKLMVSSVQGVSRNGGTVELISTQAWVGQLAASQSVYARAMAADPSESVLIAADIPVSGGSYGVGTIKWAATGAPLWTNVYVSPVGGIAYASFVGSDAAGNVYAAGTADSLTNGMEVVLLKYSGAGIPLWTNLLNPAGMEFDYPAGFAVTAEGESYLAACHLGSSSSPGIVLLKHAASGLPLWTNVYSAGYGDDFVSELALDPEGNVVIAGASDGSGTGLDYLTIKYSGAGVPLWTNRFSRSFSDMARALTIDPHGAVIVTGESAGINDSLCPTIKYSSTGAALWTNFLSGPNYSGGGVPQVDADPFGNVFVTVGAPVVEGTPIRFEVIKLDPMGAIIGTSPFDTLGTTNLAIGRPGWFSASAVDNAGNFYASGDSVGKANTNIDLLTLKFGDETGRGWTNLYDGFQLEDYASCLLADAGGNVYVAGQSHNAGTQNCLALVKYQDCLRYVPAAGFTGIDSIGVTVAETGGRQATINVEIDVLPVPKLFVIPSVPDAGLRFLVEGLRSGEAFTLEYSPDLNHWNSLSTGVATSAEPVLLAPGLASESSRFYRVMISP